MPPPDAEQRPTPSPVQHRALPDCPANTPFVPDFGVQGRARVQIFTFGRNDGPNVATTVLPFLTSAAAFQTAYVPRFLVGGILPAPGETLSAFAAGNAQIAAAYPGRFVDLGAVPTPEEMAIIGFVPDSYGAYSNGRARTLRIWPPDISRPACARAQRPETATFSISTTSGTRSGRCATTARSSLWAGGRAFPPSEETTPWSTLASILLFPLPEIRTLRCPGLTTTTRCSCPAASLCSTPPIPQAAQRHPGGGR
jgi:hypothetical protein